MKKKVSLKNRNLEPDQLYDMLPLDLKIAEARLSNNNSLRAESHSKVFTAINMLTLGIRSWFEAVLTLAILQSCAQGGSKKQAGLLMFHSAGWHNLWGYQGGEQILKSYR